MGINFNPGSEKFNRAVRSEIYVDKTELLKYINSIINTSNQYICVSRPRRFGKSMALIMIKRLRYMSVRLKQLINLSN